MNEGAKSQINPQYSHFNIIIHFVCHCNKHFVFLPTLQTNCINNLLFLKALMVLTNGSLTFFRVKYRKEYAFLLVSSPLSYFKLSTGLVISFIAWRLMVSNNMRIHVTLNTDKERILYIFAFFLAAVLTWKFSSVTMC